MKQLIEKGKKERRKERKKEGKKRKVLVRILYTLLYCTTVIRVIFHREKKHYFCFVIVSHFILFQLQEYPELYDTCSLSFGIAVLFSWVGILRYLGFMKGYNVSWAYYYGE